MYSDYDDEPEDVFLPLTSKQYQEFYDIEMAGYDEDLGFYLNGLPDRCRMLEVGCGSGRLTRGFAEAGHQVVGIDISHSMLQAARRLSDTQPVYLQMDMRSLAFSHRFDAIVIPYNTLNLLTVITEVQQCLDCCHSLLAPGGTLLIQLHLPSQELRAHAGNKTFQFRMYDYGDTGKLIKETLLCFDRHSEQIEMTERYRVRPMTPGLKNTDYAHTMILTGWQKTTWIKLLHQSGYTIQSIADNYDGHISPQDENSLLLIKAGPTQNG